MSPLELSERLSRGDALVLLDVREAEELELCRLPGSVHVPLNELGARHAELDPSSEIVCVCHHGQRSAYAAALLSRLGYEHLHNLDGGIDRWAREMDPGMPRY